MKKIITYGSFDLFHEGHYRLLQRAKEMGDYLIVGVTTQQYDESRGKLNIVDSLDERIENVKKSGFADKIIVEDHSGQKVEDIQKYGIDVFAIGSDWQGAFDYLKDFCEVIYLERTKNISSTLLRERKHPIIRIGVIGTGRIAERFIPEAKYVSGITIFSVYNPNAANAQRFAQKFELNAYSDNLEQFLNGVDAVYIASPHETHYDYAKTVLHHGKHVLCEKPMALKKAHAKELFEIAREKRCVLLEAIKTAYCPGFAQLVGIAKSGAIGKICDVEACFTRITPAGIRETIDSEYGGGFLEFGSHTMLPIFKMLGTSYKEVRFDSILAENGIDLYTKATFIFDQGMALSKSGVGVKSEGQLLIAGTKGYILAESPWWLTESFEVRYEDSTKREKYFVKFLGEGLRYEISDFAYMINGHEDRSFRFTREESVAMADTMERFLRKREEERKVRNQNSGVKIWAHRGCSYSYPENTLEAFEAACLIQGLTGIELDIQLSKDGELVVIHDETIDRTTNGNGKVKDYTLEELKKFKIAYFNEKGENIGTKIPTMRETLDLIASHCRKKGLLINIELKNNNEPYLGMEEKIIKLVEIYGLEEYIVFSSFSEESLWRLRVLDPSVKIGILKGKLSDCLRVAEEQERVAMHPSIDGIDVELPKGSTPKVIRCWNGSEPFYKQQNHVKKIYDLLYAGKRGVTDFITNIPEEYLGK